MVLNTRQIWMGIPSVSMQWAPAPLAGMQRSDQGYYESITFENGRTKSRRSAQTTSRFQMSFTGPAGGLTGTNIYDKYQNGFYGNGLIYFSDYYAGQQNALPPEWASPALIQQGWRNISSNTPTFAATATNTFNQPPQTATWSITDAINTHVYKATIAIPPTHTLYIGASGSATGTAVVQVAPYLASGALSSVTNLTLLSATASTRMNASFAGSSYTAVDVYFTRTSTAASTLSITSMMALVLETTATATLTGNHQDGEGHHGLGFSGDTNSETYEYFYPAPIKSTSIVLEEIE